ncbi:hypothetical protein K503DRAFT_696449 [Rhizopogon vinicolor AM-OR11-026]|uniref:DUF6699 domain-containing protein n=1 Tax=Rhizopogon vinicolor AM-OR11-026 TaxID=1314800 RepID=A0A1B7MT13_9AGAM|nr:hypothetical protein K503DRAFT_696449 [Rhizopogon vinicolor AM-OR11-026]
MPSPYIPHAPIPETWGNVPHGPLRRAYSLSAAYPQNPQPRAAQWNAWQPPPFHNHVGTQNIPFPAYSNASSHTPASAVSMSRPLSMSYVPPDWPGEAPKSWRRGFKFKSGFSSLFRSRSVSRLPDESTDSAMLNLAPILQYDRGYPPVILDLRRSVSLLVFRGLDRHVFASDLMQPTTDPPTAFMRLYHTRLPWYIDVVPSVNGSYVMLGDLFTAICQALARRIRGEEYYNDVLDHEDREALRLAWDERCRSQEERMDGVKRVDFLRGKYIFEGLTRGKHGMWQLRTGRERDG